MKIKKNFKKKSKHRSKQRPSVGSYLSESVEEGFGQPLTPATLSERVLASKDLRLVMLYLKAHGQFWNVDLCSVIEAGIQAFQH